MIVRAAMASLRIALQVHLIATLLSSKFTLERKVRLNWILCFLRQLIHIPFLHYLDVFPALKLCASVVQVRLRSVSARSQ
jgi:hypothetical protein